MNDLSRIQAELTGLRRSRQDMRDEVQRRFDTMETLIEKMRESVATKSDIRTENKIERAVRDITIRTGAMLVALFGALASIKLFA